jgi:hypothetical protein
MHQFIYEIIDLLENNKNVDTTELKYMLLQNPHYLYDTSKYWTCYIYAAYKSLETLITFHELYLEIQDDLPDIFLKPYELHNQQGENLLHFVAKKISTIQIKAIEIKYKNILNYILENIDVNINSGNKYNDTILHIFTKYNKVDCIKLALYYKVNPNILNYKKLKAIDYTIMYGNESSFSSYITRNHTIKLNDTYFKKLRILNIKENYKQKLQLILYNKTKNSMKKGYNQKRKLQEFPKYIKQKITDLYHLEEKINKMPDSESYLDHFKRITSNIGNTIDNTIGNTNDNTIDNTIDKTYLIFKDWIDEKFLKNDINEQYYKQQDEYNQQNNEHEDEYSDSETESSEHEYYDLNEDNDIEIINNKKVLEEKYYNNLYKVSDKLGIVNPEEHEILNLKSYISVKLNMLHRDMLY